MLGFQRKARELVRALHAGRKVTVEHVRYVKQPAITYRAKAYAMAVSMGMTEQAEVLK